jgi:antitoxin MazE
MYIMEDPMQVSKWGNSLAVRLPKSLVEALDLKEGDEIELRPVTKAALEVSRNTARRAALERLRAFEGLLPADYKFDRDEAHER